MNTIAKPEDLPLGASLPPGDPHGVSVHLPKWADTVGWASREPRVLEAMKTGYPRFFTPRAVDRLAMKLLEMAEPETARGQSEDGGMRKRLGLLFPIHRYADVCHRALAKDDDQHEKIDIRLHKVNWDGRITNAAKDQDATADPEPNSPGENPLFLVSYPPELAAKAKSFWQHTGFGISSRRATYWLENAPFLSNRAIPSPPSSPMDISLQVEQAKSTLKRRIAAGHSVPSDNFIVSEDDVFLFHTGMTAIAEAADAIKSIRPTPHNFAIFGFPYVDTFKVLSHPLSLTSLLLKHSDLPTLTTLLANNTPLSGIITEFPSNPLLTTPPLPSLTHLSQTHHTPLLIDDTLGPYPSLHLLPACDVICTSLTKMFSGACNVMGGAVVVNPQSGFSQALKQVLGGKMKDGQAEKAWYGEDVLVMEGNSRDFAERVAKAGENAARVAGMLSGEQLGDGGVVEEVYYPLGGPGQEVYDRYRVEGGGYGFLLSVKFVTAERARAFYDALDVAKGPSLGTGFTLCCAYTLLAHYRELEWAAEYGVVEDLVRISVGVEEWEWLEERVARALKAARDVS